MTLAFIAVFGLSVFGQSVKAETNGVRNAFLFTGSVPTIALLLGVMGSSLFSKPQNPRDDNQESEPLPDFALDEEEFERILEKTDHYWADAAQD